MTRRRYQTPTHLADFGGLGAFLVPRGKSNRWIQVRIATGALRTMTPTISYQPRLHFHSATRGAHDKNALTSIPTLPHFTPNTNWHFTPTPTPPAPISLNRRVISSSIPMYLLPSAFLFCMLFRFPNNFYPCMYQTTLFYIFINLVSIRHFY